MQVISENLFLIFVLSCVIAITWLPILWLALSIFTPKSLLEKYFKEPHFTIYETIFMKEFPGFLVRTGVFGWLLVFPFLDRKRNIKCINEYSPRWYCLFLKIFIYSSIILALWFLISFLLLVFLS